MFADTRIHHPVFLKEVLEIFNPRDGSIYIDGTVNGGGQALAIAENVGNKGRVLGIDWDCELVQKLEKRCVEEHRENLTLVCANYKNIASIAKGQKIEKADGIIFDLGFSSYHIEQSGRGFSFLRNEPLDMRYNIYEETITASNIVNTWKKDAIEDLLREFGEERFARSIAQGIFLARNRKKIETTRELRFIVEESVPKRYARGNIHPATRTFQALRIAVNHELENLEIALNDSMRILKSGGIIIVISFHSLEDRIVKSFFREKKKEGICSLITQKPLRPSRDEIRKNPRARSARLRAAQKETRI